MSRTTRARIVKGAAGAHAITITHAPETEPRTARTVPREIASAHDEAARIAANARTRADAILAHARIVSADVAAEAASEARAQEHAKLAATWLALHAARESHAERDLDRTIDLAVLLAERLLGAAIERDPTRIAALARQALAEAKGARRAAIDANPLDAAALRANVSDLGIDLGSIDVREDESLARGSLRVHTDLGTLDAAVTPQLERLAAALRDALRR